MKKGLGSKEASMLNVCRWLDFMMTVNHKDTDNLILIITNGWEK